MYNVRIQYQSDKVLIQLVRYKITANQPIINENDPDNIKEAKSILLTYSYNEGQYWCWTAEEKDIVEANLTVIDETFTTNDVTYTQAQLNRLDKVQGQALPVELLDNYIMNGVGL